MGGNLNSNNFENDDFKLNNEDNDYEDLIKAFDSYFGKFVILER